MNFQKARIAEVNMQLRTLVESSEKVCILVYFFNTCNVTSKISCTWRVDVAECSVQGFPLHMNLAVTSTLSPHSSDATIKMLKEQNRRLTQVSLLVNLGWFHSDHVFYSEQQIIKILSTTSGRFLTSVDISMMTATATKTEIDSQNYIVLLDKIKFLKMKIFLNFTWKYKKC